MSCRRQKPLYRHVLSLSQSPRNGASAGLMLICKLLLPEDLTLARITPMPDIRLCKHQPFQRLLVALLRGGMNVQKREWESTPLELYAKTTRDFGSTSRCLPLISPTTYPLIFALLPMLSPEIIRHCLQRSNAIPQPPCTLAFDHSGSISGVWLEISCCFEDGMNVSKWKRASALFQCLHKLNYHVLLPKCNQLGNDLKLSSGKIRSGRPI